MDQKVHIESIKLTDGIQIPLIGLGTFRATDKDVFTKAIKYAVSIGYRHFDMAWLYGNEDVIGAALKECIAESNGTLKREDFFLVSKLWNTFHSKEEARKGLEESLNKLGFDYVDLYLIHWPMGFKEKTGEPFPKDAEGNRLYSDIHYLETYRALEELYKEKKVRSIGVSNFNIRQLQEILDNCEIKPVNNQIEVNPYCQNEKLIEFCQKNNIVVSCYGPIGAGQSTTNRPDLKILLENDVIVGLAKKYNKTPAQICLRWGIQRGLVMLPKSTTPSRLLENAQVFDFTISDEDMLAIKGLNANFRNYGVEVLKGHKFYPFNED